MNSEVVFLLEEPSMKALLEVLIPRIAPTLQFRLIPHEGKTDLEKSIPRKLNAWRTPGAKFINVRDQDNDDCKVLKGRLKALVPDHREASTTVRIACRELESWILGDLEALAKAFDTENLPAKATTAKYRNPDALGNPAEEVRKIVPAYQKVSGARRVGELMQVDRNTSTSFRVFVTSVMALAQGTF
jgi:hypothetical protein